MPTYNKNTIKEAIIRIDFLNPLDVFAEEVPEELHRIILRDFPNMEVGKAFNDNIKYDASSGKLDRNRRQYKQWIYTGNEKKKKLSLTKDFCFVSYEQYVSFDDFTNVFSQALDLMNSTIGSLIARRVGIRYVNNVEIQDDSDPLNWSGLIRENLTSSLTLPGEDLGVTRSVQIMELYDSTNDFRMKFQYGMHNPDFPNLIRQKIFLLDVDAYKEGNVDHDEIKYLIPKMHDRIEGLYEKSILDPIRDMLNE